GVLNGVVGAPAKPLGMLGHIGMIRCTLIGDVERDLELALARFGDEPAEIVECAELRMHGRVAALRTSDRPRTAGIARARGQAVVGSLALRASDRMDRRQIHDIEAELCSVVEARLAVAERAMRSGFGG